MERAMLGNALSQIVYRVRPLTALYVAMVLLVTGGYYMEWAILMVGVLVGCGRKCLPGTYEWAAVALGTALYHLLALAAGVGRTSVPLIFGYALILIATQYLTLLLVERRAA
jgi:hypothetical protein